MSGKLLTADDLDKLRELIDLELDDREEQAKYGTQEDWETLDRLKAEAEPLKARIEATKEYLGRVEFATPEEIEAARNTHCWQDDGTVAVDDDARVSRCDDENASYWVSAWLLMGGDGPEEADEEEA